MDSKYRIELTENRSFNIEVKEDGSLLLDGEPVELDAVKTTADSWNVIMDNKSYNIRLMSFDMDEKQMLLQVDDEEFPIVLNDELDDLLSKMGMSGGGSSRMEDVRAPMPGLVLKIMVEAGQHITEGDALVILEAMKMENVIKATGDAVIAKILVSNQDAVEKNQVLIEME
jgi:biotin carboxyl carrier protein